MGDKFQLIAGERRWRAFQQLKIKTIPARVMTSSDASSATLAMIENLQRADLNPDRGGARLRQPHPRFRPDAGSRRPARRQRPRHRGQFPPPARRWRRRSRAISAKACSAPATRRCCSGSRIRPSACCWPVVARGRPERPRARRICRRTSGNPAPARSGACPPPRPRRSPTSRKDSLPTSAPARRLRHSPEARPHHHRVPGQRGSGARAGENGRETLTSRFPPWTPRTLFARPWPMRRPWGRKCSSYACRS